jgi:GrpB-like predicted nucleotidyltransferase (UPF0157 family)
VTADDLIRNYDPAWATDFLRLGRELRRALGDTALRIDHIGSTAVPGLAAKPIIDVQISVVSLEPVDHYQRQIESCGFIWREGNTDLTKRYFREVPPRPRTHVHVRRIGSFDEQFALLFRDYLRTHFDRANAYASHKRGLAHLLRTDRREYVDAKAAFVWETIRHADDWAQRTGWEPGHSDA